MKDILLVKSQCSQTLKSLANYVFNKQEGDKSDKPWQLECRTGIKTIKKHQERTK